MVISRLTGWSSEDDSIQLDYWIVRTESASFIVSAVEAEHVMRLLQRTFVPRWIGFRDLSGARIRVPAAEVVMVGECTREQRAYDRRLSEALDREQSGEEW